MASQLTADRDMIIDHAIQGWDDAQKLADCAGLLGTSEYIAQYAGGVDSYPEYPDLSDVGSTLTSYISMMRDCFNEFSDGLVMLGSGEETAIDNYDATETTSKADMDHLADILGLPTQGEDVPSTEG